MASDVSRPISLRLSTLETLKLFALALHRRDISRIGSSLLGFQKAAQDLSRTRFGQRGNKLQGCWSRDGAQFPSHVFDQGGGQRVRWCVFNARLHEDFDSLALDGIRNADSCCLGDC